MNKKVVLAGILLLVLIVGVGVAVYFGVNRNQNIRSKAAGNGKSGCSDTCSGDPPSCSGDTTNGTSCSSVTVSGMPDNFDAWALDDQYHSGQGTKCTVRPGTTTADCSCDVGGSTYCWMPITYLVKNVDNQGHRFYMLVYDKDNNLIGGSKTEYVAFLDNSSKKARWGYESGHDGTWIVQNCGQRKEYHEEADMFSPGSWVETGNILYATATGAGCNPTVGCNQTCNGSSILCSSPYTCTGGKCVNPSCPTTQDATCKCPGAPSCDSIAMTPTGTVVTAGSETRSLTANGTGTGTLEYTWTTTGGTLSSTTGSSVTWTAPTSLTTAQTWTVSATVKDSTNQTSTVGGCTKMLSFSPTQKSACNQTCGVDSDCETGYCYVDNPPPGMKRPTISVCRNRACSSETSCVCPPPEGTGACQMVSASSAVDLSKAKPGDTVTFTGWGSLTSDVPADDSIDKINFIVSRDGKEDFNKTVDTTLDTVKTTSTMKYWQGKTDYTIPSAASYTVVIKVHWKNKDKWLL